LRVGYRHAALVVPGRFRQRQLTGRLTAVPQVGVGQGTPAVRHRAPGLPEALLGLPPHEVGIAIQRIEDQGAIGQGHRLLRLALPERDLGARGEGIGMVGR
jgi:hypothetical protein